MIHINDQSLKLYFNQIPSLTADFNDLLTPQSMSGLITVNLTNWKVLS